MQPTFRDRPALTFLGIQRRINHNTVDWGALWEQEYLPRLPEILPFATEDACHGLYYSTDDPQLLDFIAGRPVSGVGEAPEGMVLRDLPAAHEAVFECGMGEIGPTWDYVMGQWLPASEYAHDEAAPCYERFAPGCHEGTVPVTIHVPVRRK
ncbi:MAG: GyrI-like domain-containing protein [Armatimonadetes bacterium]|nr:GyrI-like domain-containing protein [Armatimonadota bacterium]